MNDFVSGTKHPSLKTGTGSSHLKHTL
uniref:Uncharacterized protein n=1 Tax=Arundo donax TaxID=35708 RepID=A0A0A9A6N6_ARUDO